MLDKHKRFGEKAKTEARKKIVGNKYRLGMPAWNKGLHTGIVPWNKGIKSDKPSWNKGKKMKDILTTEQYSKILRHNRMLGKLKSGSNHWNWKGGITDINHNVRNSKEYKEWRLKVLQRDKFSCVVCGYRSHKRKDIRVDHIKPFSLFPELRFDIINGRTLCVPCDIKIGWNYSRYRNSIKK